MATASASRGRGSASRLRASLDRVPRPDLLALAALLTGTLVLLLYLGRDTIFLYDDWSFWAPPPDYSPGHLLEPLNGHASPTVRLSWNLLTDLTGGESFLPYRLLWYALHLTFLALTYFVLAPRIGARLALVVTVPFAIMGGTWLNLVMPISGIYQVVSLIGLLGAILALDRGTRRGDIAACVVLVLSVFTAAGGLAAIAGIAAWLLWPPTAWRRMWVVGVPLALFGLWYAIERPESEFEFDPAPDLANVPSYVVEGLRFGFNTYTRIGEFAAPLALVAVAAAAWVIGRGAVRDRAFIAVVAGGLAFWALIAIGRGPELRPDQLRFLYPDAGHAVLILVLAAAAAGLRSTWRATAVGSVLAVAFLLPNLQEFRLQALEAREGSQKAVAALTAVELAGERVPGDFGPVFGARGDGELLMDEYREALRDGRSLGWTDAEALAQPHRFRLQLDATLVEVLGIEATASADRSTEGCRPVAPGEPVPVPPDQPLRIVNGGAEPVDVQVHRFAEGWTGAGRVARRAAASLEIPGDRSARPWELSVAGAGAEVCGAP